MANSFLKTAPFGSGAEMPQDTMCNFGPLEHFQPDCGWRKCSNSLIDRVIHALSTFRPERSRSGFGYDQFMGAIRQM